MNTAAKNSSSVAEPRTPFESAGAVVKTAWAYIQETPILKWTLILLILGTIIGGVIGGVYANRKPVADQLTALRLAQKPVLEKLTRQFDTNKAQRLDASKFGWSSIVSQLAPAEQYLVNLRPLTVRLPGYIGPPTPEGSFFEDEGVRLAYAAGARAFFIPITTYVDVNKQPPLFPASGDPACIARSTAGSFLCQNGGFLKATVDAIVKYRDSLATTAGDPLLLILHQDTYVPDRKTNEGFYVGFVRKVAEAMQAITPYRVGQVGEYGETQKGLGHNSILKQIPLSALQRKIIVCTNIDTTIEGLPSYGANSVKLSDYVNIYYKTTADTTPGTKYIPLSSLVGAVDTVKETARIQLMIADTLPSVLPAPEDLESARDAGIQCVPLDLLSQSDAALPLWKQWGGRGWIVKEKALRFQQPPKVVPQKPSAKLNARVEGTQYAGQLLINS